MAPTANLDQKDRQFVAKVSPQSGLSPLRSLFSFRYELASFRSTLTTVSQVTENSTRTFLMGKKKYQSAFMKGVWPKLEALPSQIRGPNGRRAPERERGTTPPPQKLGTTEQILLLEVIGQRWRERGVLNAE